MSDEKIAQAVHEAAKTLCRALNVAGEAGLGISIEFKPYQASHCGTRLVTTGSWTPLISLKREIYFDTGR